MQSPFSELYSKYYTLTQHILSLATDQSISINELREIVDRDGFLESPLSYLPPLTTQDAEGYHLLIKEKTSSKEACYRSVLQQPPLPYLTNLEVGWLKSLLSDQKLHLFLDEEDCYLLSRALAKQDTLVPSDCFDYVRQNTQKRTYVTTQYISCFKTLLAALQEEKNVTLTTHQDGCYLAIPYKIEYAILEDSFSLLAIVMKNDTLHKLIRIPLEQLKEVALQAKAPSRHILDAFIQDAKCKEPLVFELNNMRSGFERAFMYLSPYERITEYHEENDTCLVQLYYYPFDEEKLINTLMSFGPIIKVISPCSIKDVIKKRINTQFSLFANFFSC